MTEKKQERPDTHTTQTLARVCKDTQTHTTADHALNKSPIFADGTFFDQSLPSFLSPLPGASFPLMLFSDQISVGNIYDVIGTPSAGPKLLQYEVLSLPERKRQREREREREVRH